MGCAGVSWSAMHLHLNKPWAGVGPFGTSTSENTVIGRLKRKSKWTGSIELFFLHKWCRKVEIFAHLVSTYL